MFCRSKVGLVLLETDWRRLMGLVSLTFRIGNLVNSGRYILVAIKSLSHVNTNSSWPIKWSKHLVNPSFYLLYLFEHQLENVTIYLNTTLFWQQKIVSSTFCHQVTHFFAAATRGLIFFFYWPQLLLDSKTHQPLAELHYKNSSFRTEQSG